MAKRKATLKYQWYEYTPEALESGVLSTKEIKAEYSRLRKIANRRLEALGKAGYGETQAYLRNVGQYKGQSQYTEAQLRMKLYQVSRFVEAKTSSVTGIRRLEKETLETLKEHGFGNIKSLAEFGNFMQWARKRFAAGEFDSDRVAELYNEAQRRNIPLSEVQNDFGFWYDNIYEVQDLPKYRSESKRNSAWYRKMLGVD